MRFKVGATLLDLGNPNELLSDVVAAEQTEKCVRGMLDPVNDRLAVFHPTALDPPSQLSEGPRKMLGVISDDETAR